MKIVCDNCGAKYSIADEKVAGKVFKIRCKKCSDVIVVRGDQVASEEEEATRVFDYGGEAVWHVVVQGDQQGPFAPLQLGGLLTDGKIDWESYVWKEGFDGWKPLREVPELAEALNGVGSAAPFSAEESVESDEPKAADAAAAADPDEAPTSVGGVAAVAATAAVAAPASKAAADLFAASDADGGSFGSDADDHDVVASQPSPRVSMPEASLTGQRNENSVLFSLQNLQSLATSSDPSPKAAAPMASAPSSSAGQAAGDASGLIDIRALASAASSSRSRPAGESASAGIDDLLSLGAGSALGGGLGAPVLTPAVEKEESKPNLKVLYGLVALLGIGLIGAVAYLATREPQQIVVTQEVPSAAPAPTAAAPAAPTTVAGNEAAPTGTEPAAGAVAAEEDEDAETDSRTRRTTTASTTTRDRTTTATAPTTTTTMAATTTTTTSTAMTTTRSGDSLDSLMGQVTGMTATTTTTASSLPEQPSRDAVRRALSGRSAAVAACGGEGTAMAAVTFGSSGSVSSVNVTGAGAAASCVSSAVRGARVPPFSRPSFSVSFPYRL